MASSTSVSVSGRGIEHASIDPDGDPVELLESADVGHWLTLRSPLQAGVVGLRLAGAEEHLGMSGQHAAIDAQDEPEQDLSVQAGGLRCGLVQPRCGLGEGLADAARWPFGGWRALHDSGARSA